MTQRNIEKISESVIDSDDSVVDDTVEHHIFASVAEQAQKYFDYFVSVISMCF